MTDYGRTKTQIISTLDCKSTGLLTRRRPRTQAPRFFFLDDFLPHIGGELFIAEFGVARLMSASAVAGALSGRSRYAERSIARLSGKAATSRRTPIAAENSQKPQLWRAGYSRRAVPRLSFVNSSTKQIWG